MSMWVGVYVLLYDVSLVLSNTLTLFPKNGSAHLSPALSPMRFCLFRCVLNGLSCSGWCVFQTKHVSHIWISIPIAKCSVFFQTGRQPRWLLRAARRFPVPFPVLSSAISWTLSAIMHSLHARRPSCEYKTDSVFHIILDMLWHIRHHT